MGGAWSALRAPAPALAIEAVSVRPAAESPLLSPLEIVVRLAAPAAPAWRVTFEVDVAHAARVVELCRVPARAPARDAVLRVPARAFERLAAAPGVSVDAICNVGAIRARGYVSGALVADVTLVVDCMREGFDAGAGAERLKRRVYGATAALDEGGAAAEEIAANG